MPHLVAIEMRRNIDNAPSGMYRIFLDGVLVAHCVPREDIFSGAFQEIISAEEFDRRDKLAREFFVSQSSGT